MMKIAGTHYSSLSDACRRLSIPRHRVQTIMKRDGLSPKKALIKAIHTQNRVVVFQKPYKSLADAAREYRIDPALVYKRISNGWALKDALTVNRKKNQYG